LGQAKAFATEIRAEEVQKVRMEKILVKDVVEMPRMKLTLVMEILPVDLAKWTILHFVMWTRLDSARSKTG